jgi:hypothetical protein
MSLPTEIWDMIFEYFGTVEIYISQFVCAEWYSVSQSFIYKIEKESVEEEDMIHNGDLHLLQWLISWNPIVLQNKYIITEAAENGWLDILD